MNKLLSEIARILNMDSKVIRHTVWLTISNVLTKLFAIIFTVVLARTLTANDYGLFKYVLSLASIFSILLLGIPVSLTKYISQYRTQQTKIDKYVSTGITLSILLFLLTSIVIILYGANSIFTLLVVLKITVDAFYYALIRGLINFNKLLAFRFVTNLLNAILVLIAVLSFTDISISLAIAIYVSTPIISILIFETIQNEKFRIKLKHFSKKCAIKILKFAAPVIIASVGYDIMFNIDTIIIKQLEGLESVATYSIARTLTLVFTFISGATVTLLMPKISNFLSHNNDFAYILRVTKKTLMVILLSSLTIYIAYVLFGELIIRLLFTEKYLDAFYPLLLLSLGQIFFSGFSIIWSVWEGQGKPYLPSIITILGALLNIIGNYILIPLYGINGAAISTAGVSVATFIVAYTMLTWRKGPMKKNA